MGARVFRFGFVVAIFLLMVPDSAGAWFGKGEKTIKLNHGGGALEVQLVPDKGGVLRLKHDGNHRWVFDGSTAELIGGSYSIVLRNKGSERLKVVVGVDGLNIYRKDKIVGRADADTGSILSPWETRTLKGWQMNQSMAQRFVFSPPEWSEGAGQTQSQIGLITVQVYRERRQEWFGLSDEAEGDSSAGRMKESRSRVAAPSPQIGTSSGDDVSSRVRTVSFDCLTLYPEAWIEIDYGRNCKKFDPPQSGVLGIRVVANGMGSRIVEVVRGSVASSAGLIVGDVITKIDSVDRPSPSEVSQHIRTKDPGEFVFIRVNRGHHEIDLKIRL